MSSVHRLPWETSNISNFSILDYQFTWADKKNLYFSRWQIIPVSKKIYQYFKTAAVIELTAVCNWYAIHKSRHEKSYMYCGGIA